jgi:hypothetical protein
MPPYFVDLFFLILTAQCKVPTANATSNIKHLISGTYFHQGELPGKTLLHTWEIENVF